MLIFEKWDVCIVKVRSLLPRICSRLWWLARNVFCFAFVSRAMMVMYLDPQRILQIRRSMIEVCFPPPSSVYFRARANICNAGPRTRSLNFRSRIESISLIYSPKLKMSINAVQPPRQKKTRSSHKKQERHQYVHISQPTKSHICPTHTPNALKPCAPKLTPRLSDYLLYCNLSFSISL